MMRKLLVTMAGGLMVTVAFASFSYQGALKLATGGEVVDLKPLVEFRLYTDSVSDNSCIWGGKSKVVLSAGTGFFNVEIGDDMEKLSDAERPLLDQTLADNADKTLYLGLTVVGSSGEIRPRQKLLSVPSATYARNVTQAKSGFVVENGTLEIMDNATFEGPLSVEGKIRCGSSELVGTPVGSIIVWTKSESPDVSGWATSANDSHWAICNGQAITNSNGTVVQTPDLRGRFVLGVDVSQTVGTQGGMETVSLAQSEVPGHVHNVYKVDNNPFKLASYYGARENTAASGGTEAWTQLRVTDPAIDALTGMGIVTTSMWGGNAQGANEPHENRPPFYALYYIMCVR